MTHHPSDPSLPYFDTWRPRKDVASWIFDVARSAPAGATPRERNRWVWAVTDAAIAAVASMARPSFVDVGVALDANEPQPSLTFIRLPWHKWLSKVFLADAAIVLEGLPWSAFQVEMNLEENIQARAQARGPTQRFQVELGSRLRLHAPWAGEAPSLSLDVGHTLYQPDSPHELTDNQELSALNHPQLREALEQLSERVGPLTEWEGRGTPGPRGFVE